MDSRPIGIYDSGIGGLSVVKEIIAQLPYEEIVYIGDTKRAPYGNLNKVTILEYALQMVEFLRGNNVKAIVAACNTTCSILQNTMSKHFNLTIPIIGVVEPGVEAALKLGKKSVALLATQATVNSGYYKKLLLEKEPNLEYMEAACLDFASIVESGAVEKPEAYAAAKKQLLEIYEKKPEVVILGCTHFPFMKNAIASALKPCTVFSDPAVSTAEKLKECLIENHLINDSYKKPSHQFYVTGQTEKFNFFLSSLLSEDAKAKQVDI